MATKEEKETTKISQEVPSVTEEVITEPEVKLAEVATVDENKPEVPEETPEVTPEETAPKLNSGEVTLNLGVPESIGEHTVFIGGRMIKFFDGVATVTREQAELLEAHGYIE